MKPAFATAFAISALLISIAGASRSQDSGKIQKESFGNADGQQVFVYTLAKLIGDGSQNHELWRHDHADQGAGPE